MQESEGLGPLGWGALGVLVLAVLCAVIFGVATIFWFALPLTFVALAVLIALCGGRV